MAMSHNRKSWVTKMYLEGNCYRKVQVLHNKGNSPNDPIRRLMVDREGDSDKEVENDLYCDCSSCQGYDWWKEIENNWIPGTGFYMNVNFRKVA